MKREELQHYMLVKRLTDVVLAREELERVERSVRRYLKGHKRVKEAYRAFVQSGGGTLGDLENWLTSWSPLPTLKQKRHMRLVIDHDQREAS